MVSYRSRGRIGWGMLVLVLMGATTPAMADTQKAAPDHEWFESILGVPKEANLVVSDTELQSLGCMIGATTTILGTIILSSTAIIATGGRNAATATEIAVPVLAAASMAGCVVGNSAALGIAWILRNREKLFGKIAASIPDAPLKNLLPKITPKSE